MRTATQNSFDSMLPQQRVAGLVTWVPLEDLETPPVSAPGSACGETSQEGPARATEGQR
jgi:hypothetical protein